MKKLAARIRAEDDAVGYLGIFPAEVAFVIARNVEKTLAIRWETEQEEMVRRGDPREVACMTAGDKRELDDAMPEYHRTYNPTPRLNRTLSGC